MERIAILPRPGWQERVESHGFHFHTPEGRPYWDESACYALTAREVDELEAATNELHELCLDAVEHVVEKNWLDRFEIPASYHDWIRQSWLDAEPALYGRFDLAYDGQGPPRLLEYNADTPTALMEAAVVQWFWLQETKAGPDQFNSIHERLIAAWSELRAELPGPLTLVGLEDNLEDFTTVSYFQDTATQAGWDARFLDVSQVGWNEQLRQFVAPGEEPLATVFKLYPWEWLLHEEFGPHLLEHRLHWIEPPWKMLLSNKAILAVLWELFPSCPYLLRAERAPFGSTYVQKPILAREGANVTLVEDGQATLATGGAYPGPYVYQAYQPLPRFDGQHCVVGSWVVAGQSCGIGIREDSSRITGNASRFVPHYFE